jgi:hypothetical protein
MLTQAHTAARKCSCHLPARAKCIRFQSGGTETLTPLRRAQGTRVQDGRAQFPYLGSSGLTAGRKGGSAEGIAVGVQVDKLAALMYILTSRFLGSSMVERPAVNRQVVGSSPTRGAIRRYRARCRLFSCPRAAEMAGLSNSHQARGVRVNNLGRKGVTAPLLSEDCPATGPHG